MPPTKAPEFAPGHECQFKEYFDSLSVTERARRFPGYAEVRSCNEPETYQGTIDTPDGPRAFFLCPDHFHMFRAVP